MVAGFPYETHPCDGCKQRIRWMTNDNTGKRAPVHEVPREDGNVVLVDAQTYHVLTKTELHVLDEQTLFTADPNWSGHTRYVLHFAVCPRAKVYRRRDPIGRQASR